MRMRPSTVLSTLLFSLLAACGGGAKSAATMPGGGAEASCDQVGAHVSALMAKTAGGQVPAEDVERYRSVIVESCTQDGWSEPVRACFANLTEQADPGACGDQLTPEQQKTFEQRAAASAGPAPGGSAPEGGEDGARKMLAPPPPEPTTAADPCDGGE